MSQALDELKQLPNWIGHQNKRPMNPNTGYGGSINNPEHWATFDQAWQAVKHHGWSGLGFVFTQECGIIGIDLDHCLRPATHAGGIPTPQAWARDVILCLDSYTEFSPSGAGLHILCRGAIPGNLAQTPFEMYSHGRYFTVTGREYPLGADRLRPATAELAALYAVFAPNALSSLPSLATAVSYRSRAINVGQEGSRQKDSIHRHVSQYDEACVKAALACIPVYQTYDNWLRVLLAVHAIFPDETGIALIEQWSPGYPGEVARKFRSFAKGSEGPQVTAATLFYLARQDGYRAPTYRPTLRSRPSFPYQTGRLANLWASL
jgi:hypothetical protein